MVGTTNPTTGEIKMETMAGATSPTMAGAIKEAIVDGAIRIIIMGGGIKGVMGGGGIKGIRMVGMGGGVRGVVGGGVRGVVGGGIKGIIMIVGGGMKGVMARVIFPSLGMVVAHLIRVMEFKGATMDGDLYQLFH